MCELVFFSSKPVAVVLYWKQQPEVVACTVDSLTHGPPLCIEGCLLGGWIRMILGVTCTQLSKLVSTCCPLFSHAPWEAVVSFPSVFFNEFLRIVFLLYSWTLQCRHRLLSSVFQQCCKLSQLKPVLWCETFITGNKFFFCIFLHFNPLPWQRRAEVSTEPKAGRIWRSSSGYASAS